MQKIKNPKSLVRNLLVLIVTAVVILTPISNINVFADEDENVLDLNPICTATIDDDFSDERILVVLNNEASNLHNEYASSDFSEIECKSVNNLTGSIFDYRVISESSANYKQVLSIELEEKGKDNVLAAIKELEQRDDIYYVGPDYMISINASYPNDYSLAKPWAIEKIDLPHAWDITTGSSEVTVGVLDTGIDGAHPDLKNQIDNSLCRDFTSGTEVIVSKPTDPNGHGTHVAGIIGAEGNNGIGTSGVCWTVKLASLRVFDADGYGYSSYVAKAIEFATIQNISVLNLSARWYSNNSYYDYALETIISNYSGLFVCAAGNESDNNDAVDVFPPNYSLDNLISVAASNKSDAICDFSNYGQNTVDIFAPGESINSTWTNSSYKYLNGTSMATPYVTGAAALILSVCPKLTAAEVKKLILDNVDKISAFSNKCVSGGRLNAYKSIKSINHKFSYNNFSNSTHTAYCECGVSITEEHKYTDHYEKAGSDTYHYAYCVCGDKIDQIHWWKAYDKPIDMTGTYKQCKRCLLIKKVGDDDRVTIPFNKREEEYEES